MPKNGASGNDMIIRTVKDREHPYVMIHRRLFEDHRLSLEARGLMGYLLSKPDDWQVRVPDLQRTAGVGRDQLRRILRELETAGYLVRRRTHGPDGRWRWESLVHETPLTLPSTENPSMDNPATEDPVMDNPATVQPTMANPAADRPSSARPSSANPAIYQVVTVPIKESTNNESDDSNPPSSPSVEPPNPEDATPPTPPIYSPYIAGVIMDLSRELGDSTHGPANVTQALRLWTRSGYTEEEFVAACRRAKLALRQAQAGGVLNKMAYFFTTLRHHLGLA